MQDASGGDNGMLLADSGVPMAEMLSSQGNGLLGTTQGLPGLGVAKGAIICLKLLAVRVLPIWQMWQLAAKNEVVDSGTNTVCRVKATARRQPDATSHGKNTFAGLNRLQSGATEF